LKSINDFKTKTLEIHVIMFFTNISRNSCCKHNCAC